jgi:hypothetical protein
MSPEARERSFDELASGLASGTLSRGKALRLMGAAVVGGLLASLPGIAQAAPPPCQPCNALGTSCCILVKGIPNCCEGGQVCCRWRDATGRRKACVTEAVCRSLSGHVVKH